MLMQLVAAVKVAMHRGRRKLSSDIGGRTGENVLKNKNIRKLPDGTDDFETYFTDSSGESRSTSSTRSSVSQLPGISRRSSKAFDNENTPGVTCSSSMESKSPRKVIGSRSKKNILPRKIIRKDSYGRDNYEDYYTSPGSTLVSIPENSSTVHPPQSSKSKNSFKKPSDVAHSSPITRLSSSKAIDDTDNRSGSKSEDSEEEDWPLISNNNTFTLKTRKSKGNTRKSNEKRDSCDEELLKLAEENEKAENLSDSQLYATKEANLNISKTSQIIASKSTAKKTTSRVSPEKHSYFTRSHNGTPTKPHSENTDNLLTKTTDKNSSLNKHNHEQNISKASHSNAPVSEHGKSSNQSEALKIIQKIGSKSPKNTVFPEEHHLTAPDIETSIGTQSGNMDDIRTTHENIPKNKQNTSNSHELQRNKSVNTAQDSEESSEENGVAEKESTSYGNEDAAEKSTTKRKSSLASSTGSKKKAKSFSTSARPADKGRKEHKEKMSLSLNISDRNLNRSNKKVQHVEGSLHSVLNDTFQVNNPELSLSNHEGTLRETNKSRASSQVGAEAHKNTEDGEKNEQSSKQKKANKSHENPKSKTKDKSSVSQEKEASAPNRRPLRKRMKPLETWRNQRPIYRIKDGSIHFIDTDPGTKEDDGSKKAIAARLDKYRKMKEGSKRKLVDPPKFKFKDMVLEKKVTLPLIKKFRLIPWEGEPDESGPYCIKRVIQTPNSNFGFIEIKAGKSKPLQYLPNEDIYLCLIQGKLKVLISDKEITLEEKDTIVVPRSVPYTLINNERKKALLVFSVGRYKYLENIIFR